MDDEVITPQLATFDIEAEKSEDVLDIEAEQKVPERKLAQEVADARFPLIREHFDKLIEEYGDITVLAGLESKDFEITVKTKAAIVTELRQLLAYIDQVTQMVDEDGK